ncbi:voltage-gated chloride channel family protein [Solitalea koreensis]|nr:voltage-gated chloride channel family protein [Solitalea koreensis]
MSIPEKVRRIYHSTELIPLLLFSLKWLFIASIIGLLSGAASAIFLILLDWATNYRELNNWIIALLPIAGLAIGYTYYSYGSDVVKGNNQLLEEIHSPKQMVPLKMAPLVLCSTIITHLFGGSAGREGTAVQMGGSIADQFTKIFNLHDRDRKLLLISGMSAGFASVFGTPLAGLVFGLEVFLAGGTRYTAILPALFAALIADWTCRSLGVVHTVYHIPFIPKFTPITMLYAVVAGLFFGLTARAFSVIMHWFQHQFARFVKTPYLRPFFGGIIIAALFYFIGTRYAGLGIPLIKQAFVEPLPYYDFILKLLFTAFTLGCGFKGGEVTPLFFIGATLGNILTFFIPLPLSLLAGMGFVAVFAGASNTPIACTLMGLELFGIESGLFIAIACIVAYIFSGHSGIYGSQIIEIPKHALFGRHSGKSIQGIREERSNV